MDLPICDDSPYEFAGSGAGEACDPLTLLALAVADFEVLGAEDAAGLGL